MSKDTLPVIEIFGPTIQGEGPLCGHVSHFIRFGGCPYRCTWCDSMYAVDPEQIKANKTDMMPGEIVDKILTFGHAPWITLTGGDPVMWDLSLLVKFLQNRDFKVSVETEGYLWADWLQEVDQVVVSPKGPSSGMRDKFDSSMLEKYSKRIGEKLSIKNVVFNNDDLLFAKSIHRGWDRHKMYLSVGTERNAETQYGQTEQILEALYSLSQQVLGDPELSDVVVLPQMHTLIWGNKRGV